MPNNPRGSKMRNTMISTPYSTVSSWYVLGVSDGMRLMPGTRSGTSRANRGSSVIRNAPRIEPEMVPTPPISTIAMNCTDSSRLNEPGSKNPA